MVPLTLWVSPWTIVALVNWTVEFVASGVQPTHPNSIIQLVYDSQHLIAGRVVLYSEGRVVRQRPG